MTLSAMPTARQYAASQPGPGDPEAAEAQAVSLARNYLHQSLAARDNPTESSLLNYSAFCVLRNQATIAEVRQGSQSLYRHNLNLDAAVKLMTLAKEIPDAPRSWLQSLNDQLSVPGFQPKPPAGC